MADLERAAAMNFSLSISNAIAAFPKIVAADEVAAASARMGVSPTAFCDLFAKQVAHDYLAGRLPWTDADMAMTALSGYFFTQLPEGEAFPDYAFGVFLAFDAGETAAEPEEITRAQLNHLPAPA